MKAMQKKVLDKIQSITEKAGLEFVQNPAYANTGTVQLMKDFTTIVHFGYSFQDTYAVLQFYPGDKEIHNTCGFVHADCINNASFSYHEGDRINKMFDWLTKTLEAKNANRNNCVHI